MSMVTLEVYQLLTLAPVTITTFLLPPGYLLVMLLVSKLILARCRWDETRLKSLSGQQRQHFLCELSVYAIIATGSIIVSTALLDIPLTDVLCSGLIILTFGYFAGVDTTLAASRDWFGKGVEQNLETFRLIPTSVSLRHATLSILTLILLFSLSAVVKLNMALSIQQVDYQPIVTEFAVDLLFYLLMLSGLMVWTIRGYSRNLHHILEPQLKVLRDAQAGEFTQKIPILSQNELGLMGIQLNRLIDHVHEREKVEHMLKRVVSPDVMEKLLTTDTETLKQGEAKEVAILFCDIRGFTEMSEVTSAEELILFLNTFFSELSGVVSQYNGIINKFMGDAILAVFSTEHPAWAIDNAMATALDISKLVRHLKLPNGSPAEAGIGIHFGSVDAGTIGSEQRYEYTFFGDAVNTASRLEGLSKRLEHTIIISSEAYQMLSSPLKSSFVDLGRHQVRGKSELIHVFGGPTDGLE